MNRREFLRGLLATAAFTAIPGATDAIAETLEKNRPLKEQLDQLQKDLRKGGKFYEMLRDPRKMNEAMLTEMRSAMTSVGEGMRAIHFKREPMRPEIGQYIISSDVPGTATRTYGGGIFCNANILSDRGVTYEVVPSHCLANAPEKKTTLSLKRLIWR